MRCRIEIAVLVAVVYVFGMPSVARATVVDVNTATDKMTYLLGEDVTIFVTAYNPNAESVTLTFGDALQRSYLIDDVYDWRNGHSWSFVPTWVAIEPYDTHTWELIHGSYEMTIYPLDIGTHTVIGEVVGYGYSEAVEFEVVPEPATFLLLAAGVFAVRATKRNKSRQYK